MAMKESEGDQPLRNLGLWLGMVGPPSIWLIQFQTIYMLVYRVCGTNRTLLLHITCFSFLMLIVALGIYPLRIWQNRSRSDAATLRPRGFMAIVGVMTTALFALVQLAQWIAAFVVDPCPM